MKFECPCGAIIRDNTDYQKHKAYYIPDELYEGAVEKIEAGASPWVELRKVRRIMYQCSECCRLFFDKPGSKNLFISYKPEEETSFGLLSAEY